MIKLENIIHLNFKSRKYIIVITLKQKVEIKFISSNILVHEKRQQLTGEVGVTDQIFPHL
jgi:hypothetical protein